MRRFVVGVIDKVESVHFSQLLQVHLLLPRKFSIRLVKLNPVQYEHPRFRAAVLDLPAHLEQLVWARLNRPGAAAVVDVRLEASRELRYSEYRILLITFAISFYQNDEIMLMRISTKTNECRYLMPSRALSKPSPRAGSTSGPPLSREGLP